MLGQPNNKKNEAWQLGERRKWQIARRRYLVEQQPVTAYAPYFGLDIAHFRQWVGLQFDKHLSWSNFGKEWQLDSIVPVSYFDLSQANDVQLCWHFTNTKVTRTGEHTKESQTGELSAKRHFEKLFQATANPICGEMLIKINEIDNYQVATILKLQDYLISNAGYLQTIGKFQQYEFNQLNTGISLEELLAEQRMLNKFGN